jgi:hypothetical protein
MVSSICSGGNRDKQDWEKLTLKLTSLRYETEQRDDVRNMNSMVWVRERTTPTERPTLCQRSDCQLLRIEVPRGQRDGSLRPYSRFSRQEPLLFYQVAPQLYSPGWVDPVPDTLLFFSGSAGNPGLRICSQELWPLDHRGGPMFVS